MIIIRRHSINFLPASGCRCKAAYVSIFRKSRRVVISLDGPAKGCSLCQVVDVGPCGTAYLKKEFLLMLSGKIRVTRRSGSEWLIEC